MATCMPSPRADSTLGCLDRMLGLLERPSRLLPPQLLNLRPFPIVRALLLSQPGATVSIFIHFPTRPSALFRIGITHCTSTSIHQFTQDYLSSFLISFYNYSSQPTLQRVNLNEHACRGRISHPPQRAAQL